MGRKNLGHAGLPEGEPTKQEAQQCEQVLKDFKFRTNEGSGMGSSVRFIKKLCPGANVDDGTPIHGAEAANADRQAQQIANLAQKYYEETADYDAGTLCRHCGTGLRQQRPGGGRHDRRHRTDWDTYIFRETVTSFADFFFYSHFFSPIAL